MTIKKLTRETNITAMGGNITAEVLDGRARRWQNEAFSKWLGLEDHRMTVKAATGAGKTYLATMIIFWWLNLHGEDAKIVFCVPTTTLVKQTAEHLRGWRIKYARCSSAYGNEHQLNKPCYITTYQSLKKVKANKHLKGKKILIIGDECHTIGAEKTKAHFIGFQGDACLLLSATPERDDDISVMQIMNAPLSFELNLIEGIEQSRTSNDALDFTVHYCIVKPNPIETSQLYEIEEEVRIAYHSAKSAVDKAGGNPDRLLSYQNKSLGGDAASALQSYKYKTMMRKRMENEIEQRYDVVRAIMRMNIGVKSMYLHETILGIERLNQMCMDEGVNPHVYHSGMELTPDQAITYPELNTPAFKNRLKDYSKNAKRELTRWKESASDALLSCKSLKEGFNVPDLSLLTMMTGTNSVRSRIQTIGRIFRGASHKDIYFLVLDGVGENGSGDERCFWRVIEATGIPHDKIKYTTLAMLQAGVASVSQGQDNEYMSFPSSDEEEEPFTFVEDEPLTEDSL